LAVPVTATAYLFSGGGSSIILIPQPATFGFAFIGIGLAIFWRSSGGREANLAVDFITRARKKDGSQG
jgi:hypothetical protein